MHRPGNENCLRVHFNVRLDSLCLPGSATGLVSKPRKRRYLCGVALLWVFGVLAVGRCGSTLGCPATLDGPNRACVCVESLHEVANAVLAYAGGVRRAGSCIKTMAGPIMTMAEGCFWVFE